MDASASLVSAGRDWFRRRALFFKLAGVGFFGLLLLIPLSLVQSTLVERQARSWEAVESITSTWGKSQRLLGPVLVVPYTYTVEFEETTMVDGRRVKERKSNEFTAEAFFLPETLEVAGTLEPSMRQRGIYTAHVYTAALSLSGRFTRPDFSVTGVANPQPQWSKARVGFAISDLRGTREALALTWNGTKAELQPGARLDGFTTGLHAPVTLAGTETAMEFSMDLTLNGSDAFTLAPMARATRLKLESTWPDPSFAGSYLPTQRTVTAAGFAATWQVSYYGRSFPQQWTNRSGERQPTAQDMEEATFGVRMAPAVSGYRTVERAIKYGVLFVALVFMTFFLFETAGGARLNSLNYLLVGAALCLFFLGLLALSEVVSFILAYAIAAAAATALVGVYGGRVMHSARRGATVGGMLAGVYSYLYFVLRMEDFSLLAGTAALFAMLAAVMYATRNLRTDAEAEIPLPPPLPGVVPGPAGGGG